MTIHPVRMNGLVLGIPQTLSYFDRMQERITNFVTRNSSMSAEKFRELMMKKDELVMDVGSVVDGETAVKEGLIDELGGLSEAIARLYELIEQRQEICPAPAPQQENSRTEERPAHRRSCAVKRVSGERKALSRQ